MDQIRSMDENGDGVIDLDEWSAVMEQLGFRANPETVKNTFDAIDVDGSGTIEFSELEEAIESYKPIKAKLKQVDVAALLSSVILQNRARILDLVG